MGYSGVGSYAYMAKADPSAAQHIPLNPLMNLDPPKPKYVDTIERTFDSLDPKYIYTSELAPGEGPLEMSFRDPFLLLMIFTHKTVGGTWTTGTGTITADFTDVDDVDQFFLQYYLKDQASTNHVQKLLKNGLPMKYSWVIKAGKALKEIIDIKFLDFETNVQAMSCSNDFHDQAWGSGVGGWANWDNTGLGATGKRIAMNMVLHWGAAVLTALKIKEFTLEFEIGYDSEQTVDGLAHSVYYPQVRNFKLTASGLLYDLTAIAQFEQIYASRTKQTLQVYYDHTTNYEKYLQFTNAYISPDSKIASIPEAGKPCEVDLIILGGEATAASFSGKYKDRPTPAALITTSP